MIHNAELGCQISRKNPLRRCAVTGFNVIGITRGWAGVKFPGKITGFNVIGITRGWVGVKFPGKKGYVTLEMTHQIY